MFCGECGTENPDTNQFCKNCGNHLKKPPAAPAVPGNTAPATVTSAPVAAQPAEAGSWKNHVFAIAAIACGVLSFAILTYILATLAVIFGIVAVAKKDTFGFIGIAAALISVVIDLFYFFIF